MSVLFEWVKEFNWLIATILGFLLARLGSKFDRKVKTESSKEMYLKNYILYRKTIYLLETYIKSYYIELEKSKITLHRINKQSEYVKNVFLDLPLEIIPKDIFIKHREFLEILVHFELSSKMDSDFLEVKNMNETIDEHLNKYNDLLQVIKDIEEYLNVKKYISSTSHLEDTR